MPTIISNAQIAKRTKEHLVANWNHNGVDHGLTENQLWRIGYLYACSVIPRYWNELTYDEFEALHFDCVSEALEEFWIEQERNAECKS